MIWTWVFLDSEWELEHQGKTCKLPQKRWSSKFEVNTYIHFFAERSFDLLMRWVTRAVASSSIWAFESLTKECWVPRVASVSGSLLHISSDETLRILNRFEQSVVLLRLPTFVFKLFSLFFGGAGGCGHGFILVHELPYTLLICVIAADTRESKC